MAVQTRLLRIQWENNVSVKCDTKLDDGAWVLILQMDENQHLSSVWDSHVTGIITAFVDAKLAEIGNEMKAP